MSVSVKPSNVLLPKAMFCGHICQLVINTLSHISGYVSSFDYDVDVTNTVASVDGLSR